MSCTVDEIMQYGHSFALGLYFIWQYFFFLKHLMLDVISYTVSE